MVIVETGGGAGWFPVSLQTSRHTALTRRCVSSRRKRRPHFGHLAREDGITTDGRTRC